MRKIRKIDYIVVFILYSVVYASQLFKFDLKSIVILIVSALITSLVIGSITNLLFKKKTA